MRVPTEKRAVAGPSRRAETRASHMRRVRGASLRRQKRRSRGSCRRPAAQPAPARLRCLSPASRTLVPARPAAEETTAGGAAPAARQPASPTPASLSSPTRPYEPRAVHVTPNPDALFLDQSTPLSAAPCRSPSPPPPPQLFYARHPFLAEAAQRPPHNARSLAWMTHLSALRSVAAQ